MADSFKFLHIDSLRFYIFLQTFQSLNYWQFDLPIFFNWQWNLFFFLFHFFFVVEYVWNSICRREK